MRLLHHQDQKNQAKAAKLEEVICTCPMHLEIQQSSPGNCPLCGMSLELMKAEAGNTTNYEYLDMRRRFWLALILTLPVFIMEMSGHWQDQTASASV